MPLLESTAAQQVRMKMDYIRWIEGRGSLEERKATFYNHVVNHCRLYPDYQCYFKQESNEFKKRFFVLNGIVKALTIKTRHDVSRGFLCPACAIISGTRKKPTRGCPRRLCLELDCIFNSRFYEVPSYFKTWCTCRKHCSQKKLSRSNRSLDGMVDNVLNDVEGLCMSDDDYDSQTATVYDNEQLFMKTTEYINALPSHVVEVYENMLYVFPIAVLDGKGKIPLGRIKDFCHVSIVENDVEAIAVCDCNTNAMSKLLYGEASRGSAGDVIKYALDAAVAQGYPQCVHCLTFYRLKDRLVTSNSGNVINNKVVSKVSYGDGLYSVAADGDNLLYDRAVVQALDGTDVISCLKCFARQCKHIRSFCTNEGRKARQCSFQKRRKPTEMHIDESLFPRKIPINNIKEMISMRNIEAGEVVYQGRYNCECDPVMSCVCGSVCPICKSEWMDSPVNDYVDEIKVFLRTVVVKVKGKKVKCTNCSKLISWDGVDKALFRPTKNTAIAVELLELWWNNVREGHTSFSSVYLQQEKDYDLCSVEEFVCRSTFNSWMWTYLERVDVNYKALATCPSCGSLAEAPVLVGDAQALAIRKEMLDDDYHRYRPIVPNSKTREGTKFKDRVLTTSKRVVIQRFCGSTKAMPEKYEAVNDALSENEFLRPFVNYIMSREGSEIWVNDIFAAEATFIKSLCTGTSVYGLLIRNCERMKLVLQSWVNSRRLTPEEVILVRDYAPKLSCLLSESKCNYHEELPDVLVPIVERLAEKCELNILNDEVMDDRSWHPVSEDEDLNGGRWLPGMTSERHFHEYKTPTRDWEAFECNKDYHGKHKSLLPGYFTLNCPHGFYLGFFLLTEPESPETFFSVLYSRFPNASKVIVYDNGCKLLEYVLNREPQFFKNSMILIDRLHYPNHTGCPVGAGIEHFWWLAPINSEAAEQGNSSTVDLKANVSYMTLYHFGLYMREIICYYNKKKLDKGVAKKNEVEFNACIRKFEAMLADMKSLGATEADK